jgi:MFS transporter, PAT family, beta-lactamase induction signal transducer AmpG
MGLANMPFGFYGAAVLITVPQLLAARGVPQPTIAAITATAMIPTFCGFLVAPILDVHFNRRSYAIFFGLLCAALAMFALVSISHLGRFTALLVAGFLGANLFYNALGGWLGDIVGKGDEGKLGASFTIGSVGGFGAGAISFITLMRWLPEPFGAIAVGGLIATPVLLCLFIPPSPTLRRGVKESFAALFRDVAQLIRKPAVLRTLFMFGLPAASFALTNSLGGLGSRFGASEQFVAVMAGTGVTVAAILSCMMVPLVLKRVSARPLYLAVGSVGALFTLSLILMPRTPAVFALALVGENVFQAAAFVVESTIVFRSIGDDNPLAATQFALLQAATALPITYMQAVDGGAFSRGGMSGMFLVDAGLSLVACAVLMPLVLRWNRVETSAARAMLPLPT